MNVNYRCISVAEAKALLSAEPEAVLLDIRDACAFDRSHDPLAIRLDDHNLRPLIRHTPKETPILVCCYHGHNSRDIARLFADFGFRRCYSIDGGYEQWRTVTLPRPRHPFAFPTYAVT